MIVTLRASVLAAALAIVVMPALAQQKQPPACEAIDFHPVANGLPDGEQEVGMYKSLFGRLEVRAVVKGGRALDYLMAFNGKKAQPLTSLPKSVEGCLAKKKVPMPTNPDQQACGGTKLKVVLDGSASQKLALLYGLRGKIWRFCQAAQV